MFVEFLRAPMIWTRPAEVESRNSKEKKAIFNVASMPVIETDRLISTVLRSCAFVLRSFALLAVGKDTAASHILVFAKRAFMCP